LVRLHALIALFVLRFILAKCTARLLTLPGDFCGGLWLNAIHGREAASLNRHFHEFRIFL